MSSLKALPPTHRGRKADPHSALVGENKWLHRENAKLLWKFWRTEVILCVQKIPSPSESQLKTIKSHPNFPDRLEGFGHAFDCSRRLNDLYDSHHRH